MTSYLTNIGALRAGLALLLLTLAAGCGPGEGEVTGKVTYKDKPLTSGSVSIMDSTGKVLVAEIRPDGTYTITNVATGPAKIVVTCLNTPEGNSGKGRGDHTSGGPPKVQAVKRGLLTDVGQQSVIPLRYGDFSQTDLQLKVERGNNPFDLKLR
jgi:hypothetical protein